MTGSDSDCRGTGSGCLPQARTGLTSTAGACQVGFGSDKNHATLGPLIGCILKNSHRCVRWSQDWRGQRRRSPVKESWLSQLGALGLEGMEKLTVLCNSEFLLLRSYFVSLLCFPVSITFIIFTSENLEKK